MSSFQKLCPAPFPPVSIPFLSKYSLCALEVARGTWLMMKKQQSSAHSVLPLPWGSFFGSSIHFLFPLILMDVCVSHLLDNYVHFPWCFPNGKGGFSLLATSQPGLPFFHPSPRARIDRRLLVRFERAELAVIIPTAQGTANQGSDPMLLPDRTTGKSFKV